ncbi:MAG: zinc ribbon domain-containing protein [Bacteroidota bacterium]
MTETAPTLAYAPMPASALAYLLRRRQESRPGPLAPFHHLDPPAPLDAVTVQALAASRALDARDPTQLRPAFAKALDVLLNPEVVLTVRHWTLTTRAEATLYGPRAAVSGSLVALNRGSDGRLHLIAPLDVQDALNIVKGPALDALALASHLPFEAHLDLTTAAAWLGTIDHARARVWDGTARPDDPAPAGDIVAFIQQWWGITGLDAGLTALPVLTDTPTPPTDEALRTALRQLVDHGLLGSGPRGLVPLGVTRRLVYDGRLDPLGLQWQQTHRDEHGPVVGHRIVLVRAGGLALCLDRSVPGHILIRTVTLDTLADELADRMLVPASTWLPDPRPMPQAPAEDRQPEPNRQEARQPEAPARAGETCDSCGAPRRDGAAFCTVCGAAFAPQPAGFCTQCGAALTPGASFCTSCGHRVA